MDVVLLDFFFDFILNTRYVGVLTSSASHALSHSNAMKHRARCVKAVVLAPDNI